MSLFEEAIAAFDALNATDPNTEIVSGLPRSKELLYAERMSHWMMQLAPEPSEALKLAARAQHIARWKRPRSDYPAGRTGYLKWRTQLYRFHADTATEILETLHYDPNTIEDMRSLLLKKHLKERPEMQILEDVICLVFLEHYFSDFSKKYDEAKTIEVIQKTWKKMTARGHEAALQLKLTPENQSLIQKALSS